AVFDAEGLVAHVHLRGQTGRALQRGQSDQRLIVRCPAAAERRRRPVPHRRCRRRAGQCHGRRRGKREGDRVVVRHDATGGERAIGGRPRDRHFVGSADRL
ncbi:MAG: hypothetical protein ACK559_07590, partial [bacterium]